MKFLTCLDQSVKFIPVMNSSHNLYLSSLTICTGFSKIFSNSWGGGGGGKSQFPTSLYETLLDIYMYTFVGDLLCY